MAFDMIAALSTNNGEVLEATGRDFRTAQARVKSNLEALPKTTAMRSVQSTTLSLLALADGKTGVFKVRQQELDTDDYGQTILEETRKLNVGLGISVQQLVDGVQKETDAATWQARQEISFATMVMLALGISTLVGSILFVWLYVGRNILRRISNLQRSMQVLSSGDLDSEVYQSHAQDEIGAMADSLQVFRESMIQSRALSAEQDKDRVTKSERASRMEARIVEFESTVRTALDSLQSAAGSMQSTAQSMSATADQSNALVTAVATAAEQTSANVQTVSSGTEELSSSIEEIGRQVITSAEIARKAVDDAGATDATMQGLADNAARISVVVDLIQTIARRPIQKAPNGPFEAARRRCRSGFAVVASEVKSLANQTAKATTRSASRLSARRRYHDAWSGDQNISTISADQRGGRRDCAAVESRATREIARNIPACRRRHQRGFNNIVRFRAAAAKPPRAG
jgi:methyl-accepting chemotaxis protein